MSLCDCDDDYVVRPDQAHNEGQLVPKTPTVLLQQGTAPVVELVLRGPSGRPLDLTCAAVQDSSTSSESSAAGAFGGSIVVRFSEPFSACREAVEAEVVAAQAGRIRLRMTESLTAIAQLLRGDVGVHADSRLVVVYPFWALVERNTFGADPVYGKGLPVVADIRVQVRDNFAEDNYLLRRIEHDATEIVEAMVRMVRRYNDAKPPIGGFNTANFPAPGQLQQGVIADLCSTLMHWHLRNHMTEETGGVTVDDHNKFSEYAKIGQAMMAEYDKWVDLDRRSRNAQGFAGGIGGPVRGVW